MSLPPVHPEAFAPMVPEKGCAPAPSVSSPAPFSAELDAAVATDRDREARMVAEQLVATTFIEPVLAMLREANQLAGPFAPGSAERRFTPMLDQQLAERIIHGTHFPLVDRITEGLLSAPGALTEDHDHAAP